MARVVGRIHFPDDSTTPSLDVAVSDGPTKWEPSVFVGDVRLTEFKKILQAEGIQAEFKGEGILVCNDQVAVRKVSCFVCLLCLGCHVDHIIVDWHWSIACRRCYFNGLLQNSFLIIFPTCYFVKCKLTK